VVRALDGPEGVPGGGTHVDLEDLVPIVVDDLDGL
jgi:hypothetical protein